MTPPPLSSHLSGLEHPYVRSAEVALELARRAVEKAPWPYEPGQRVLLRAPTGTTYWARVASCDEEWLLVQMDEPPAEWGDGRLRFYATSSPERIDPDGVLHFETLYRESGGAR